MRIFIFLLALVATLLNPVQAMSNSPARLRPRDYRKTDATHYVHYSCHQRPLWKPTYDSAWRILEYIHFYLLTEEGNQGQLAAQDWNRIPLPIRRALDRWFKFGENGLFWTRRFAVVTGLFNALAISQH
jgi:hypothetical protein